MHDNFLMHITKADISGLYKIAFNIQLKFYMIMPFF